jgi:hypothetical protein
VTPAQWRDFAQMVERAKLGAFEGQLREELGQLRAQAVLVRHLLGLSPAHDAVEAVRMLYEEGRAAFDARAAGLPGTRQWREARDAV